VPGLDHDVIRGVAEPHDDDLADVGAEAARAPVGRDLDGDARDLRVRRPRGRVVGAAVQREARIALQGVCASNSARARPAISGASASTSLQLGMFRDATGVDGYRNR
jgi:hypothetical protein